MNKKNIIQIVIIFACFAASGIVIYNNFFKKVPLPPSLIAQTTPAGKSDASILPNGATFDLNQMKNSSFRFNLIDYPKLDFSSQVGVDVQQILKPLHNTQSPASSGTTNKK